MFNLNTVSFLHGVSLDLQTLFQVFMDNVIVYKARKNCNLYSIIKDNTVQRLNISIGLIETDKKKVQRLLQMSNTE